MVKPEEAEAPFNYESPADAPWAHARKDLDGSFTIESTAGVTRTFDASGKISAISDRFGSTLQYSYDGGGRLDHIVDAVGHRVDIGYYSSTGRVRDVTDLNGRKTEFVYNYYGQLSKIKTPVSDQFPGGRTYQFVYSNGGTDATLQDNMVRAKDPKGQVRMKNEFDESDRVVKQYLGADSFTFAYDPGNHVTTVYDREGNKREWETTTNLSAWLKEYSNRDVREGDPTYWQTSFGYDTPGFRNKVVFPRGNRMDTTRDGVGNVTEVRRKEADTNDSNGSDIVDAYTYDASYNLMTSHTDSLGNTTTYGLGDGDKVVETVTHETVTYLAPDQTAERVNDFETTGC